MDIDHQSASECLDLSVYWNRIGNIYTLKGEYDAAMDCFTKSLENGGLTLGKYSIPPEGC
jgi:tetratricopeptide (TPR) repeat protein